MWLRSPHWTVLLSSVLAGLALAASLWITRGQSAAAWREEATLTLTPERAAESFIDASRRQAYERAAHFATGPLARELRGRAKSGEPASVAPDARRFILQESHWLRAERLRLIGVLVNDGEDETSGQTIAVTLVRHDDRYLVEDVDWQDTSDVAP
jgi:hypothetical protein